MSAVSLTAAELTVELTPAEKVAGLHGDVTVPLSAITAVEVVPDPLAAAHGLRAPGMHLPGARKVGTWRTTHGAEFVVVKRNQAGVRLTLAGQELSSLLVGVDDAQALAERIRAAMSNPVTAGVQEVELRFPGPDRDLAGTLTLPDGAGPFPAAVLVSGSGPVDRDANAPGLAIDCTHQLAAALARAGIASLRYDKRGVAGSRLRRDGTTEDTDGWKQAGLFDNADDVTAAVTALAARAEADPTRLFLVGHSEGATLVIHSTARLLAAPAGPHPAGVVLLSAAAVPGDAVLRWQAAAIVPTLPTPVRALLRLLRVDVVAKVSRNHDKIRATTGDTARIGLARINARWFREYLDHDPRPDLARLDVPVLAVTGSKDLQVDPDDLAAIADTVPGPVQTWLAPDVTHLLRTQPGAPSLRAYKQEVGHPVDPDVLDRVTGWLTTQAATTGRATVAPSRGDLASPAASAERPTTADPSTT